MPDKPQEAASPAIQDVHKPRPIGGKPKREASHVISALFGDNWAITEPALLGLIQIANRDDLTPRMVEAKLGRRIDNAAAASIRNGVASLPIRGPILRYANIFTEMSGATSIQQLGTDFQVLLDDPAVKSIVLEIDSPGGQANGTPEFADMVFQARGTKPITAYVSGMGCSAAYWIASAADSIITDQIGTLGSIGVVAAYPNKKNTGEVEFVSSQSPNKRPDVNTDKGRAVIQTHVDDMADVFINAVARNRGVTPETVLESFGQGGTFVGQKAVDAGLADALGSYEGTIAQHISMQNQTNGGPLMETNATDTTATEEPVAEETPNLELQVKTAPKADAPTDTGAELKAALATIKAIEEREATALARLATLEANEQRANFTEQAKTFAVGTENIEEAVGFMMALPTAELRDKYVAQRQKDHAVVQAADKVLAQTNGSSVSAPSGVMAEIEAEVEKLRASDNSLSIEQARTKVYRSNPGLVQRVLAENPGAVA